MPRVSKRAPRTGPPLAQLTPAAWLEALRADVERARIIEESAGALRELLASPPDRSRRSRPT